MRSFSESYRKAGVDITAGYEGVKLMSAHVKRTVIPGVVSDIGGFGGLFAPDLGGMQEPVLVSGTDGVGTKLRIAQLLDKHDTVGIDCVAMCVNDIICCGAKPQFFLDYIACGKNIPSRIEQIVTGIADGCRQSKCALIGGETAEMPGFYPEDEYDLAGFTVGIVDEPMKIDGSKLAAGDVLVGLASSGVHSNGYSLVRKTLDINNTYAQHSDELGCTLGEALLVPTRIYVRAIEALATAGVDVHAISHITGGGFYENVPRMMQPGLTARIDVSTFPMPRIFDIIQKTGSIPVRDMYNTFNMGIGMIAAVPAAEADQAIAALKAAGETAYLIGSVVNGEDGVEVQL